MTNNRFSIVNSILPLTILFSIMIQTNLVSISFANDSSIYPTEILYFGDVTLWRYLTNWCSQTPPKSQIVVIGDLLVSSPIVNQLRSLQCQFKSYSILSEKKFSSKLLLNTLEFSFYKLLILFDFTTVPRLNQSQFNRYLIELDHGYMQCHDCYPFITLFDLSTDQLRRWSTELYPKFSKYFRTVLVSNNHRNKPSVVHIKPILNGCDQYQGVLVPRRQSEFDQLKVPFQKCNLNSTTLTVMAFNVLPYCHLIKRSNDQWQMKFSIESEILKILMKQFNFNAIFESEKIYGKIVNGHGTGNVGRVYNQTADIGMCLIAKDPERNKYLDYGMVSTGELTFMSAMPQLKSRHWIVAYPFNLLVWISILVSFVILSVIIAIFVNFKPLKPKTPAKETNRLLTKLNSIAFNLLLIVLNQSCQFQAYKQYRVRLIFGSWILVSLVLSYAYVGQFYSILTLAEFEEPIDTVEQLLEVAQHDTAFIHGLANSSQLYRFIHSSPENKVNYIIGQHINRTKPNHFKSLNEITEAFDSPTSKTVFINERRLLMFIRRFYSRQLLYIARENLRNGQIGFIFPKKSPLYFPFRKIMERIYSYGYMEGWIKQISYRFPVKNLESPFYGNPSVERRIAPLKLNDLISVFYIFILGILISCIVLVCEIFIYFLLLHY